MKVLTYVSWHEKNGKRHKVRCETDVAMLTSVSRRMCLFLFVLRDGKAVDFESKGFSAGRRVKIDGAVWAERFLNVMAILDSARVWPAKAVAVDVEGNSI